MNTYPGLRILTSPGPKQVPAGRSLGIPAGFLTCRIQVTVSTGLHRSQVRPWMQICCRYLQVPVTCGSYVQEMLSLVGILVANIVVSSCIIII